LTDKIDESARKAVGIMLLFCSDQPLLVRLAGADRPTGTRSPQRDKDQEVSWCSDFDKLKEFLKSQG
jgi:hypothetical protein